jgi:hypothetical protein
MAASRPASSPASVQSRPAEGAAGLNGFARHLDGTGSVPGRTSVASAPGVYRIRPGDTLSQIAYDQLKQSGRPHAAPDIARAVKVLATANDIADPDRIVAGASLRLVDLAPGVAAAPRAQTQPPDFSRPQAMRAFEPISNRVPARPGASAQFPVLDRTLDRAIQNGYLSASERQPVHDRIVELSRKYRFSPDDFATVSLIESDGLNPRASNGNCFGIIQFCGGTQAGAAAIGMAHAPQQIAERPVLEQLDMVDRYFEHNGLQRLPQVGLVDLYLTILTPAAKAERAPAAPLPIPGTQARVLHENQDRSQPITRKSILAGLVDHARQMLYARPATAHSKASGNGGGNFLPLAGNGATPSSKRPG